MTAKPVQLISGLVVLSLFLTFTVKATYFSAKTDTN